MELAELIKFDLSGPVRIYQVILKKKSGPIRTHLRLINAKFGQDPIGIG